MRSLGTYAAPEGRALPLYGLAAGVGVTTSLLVGTLIGHAAASVPAALGAFYVAFAGPSGPYGVRARSMLAAVAVVTVFTWIGGLLNGHPWAAAVIVPLVAAAGAALSWMGPTAALCTLVAAVRPPTSPVFLNGLLEAAGGLWVCVLLLTPWLTDRLRPLRVCAAEAARAVGDAVAALPDDDKWEGRRSAGYAALRGATATYGLYGDPGQDEKRRPERLIGAFGRTMDLAVAARSLLVAVRAEAPPTQEWERELRAVTAALAGRLRELADAVETAATPPDGPVCLDRFVRVGGELRRTRLADRCDLVGAALVLQVRRIVERLSAAVEEAAGYAAGGLRAGFDTPLPGRDGVVAALTTGSPGRRHAARVGIAIAVSLVVADGLHLPYGYWLPITVMCCLRDSYGDTVERAAKRVAGTTVGAIAAALALAVVPGRATLLVLVFVGAAFGFALGPVNHAYRVTFVTPMMMLLIDFSRPLDWRAAALRIALTVGGAIIALASARLLWPAGTRRLLPERLARLTHTHAELARTVAALFDGRRGAPARERMDDAAAAAVAVEESAQQLAREPTPPDDLLRRLRDSTSAARRLRDDLGTLGALAAGPVDAGPIPHILERVADLLDRPEETKDVSGLLDELDDHLCELSRRRRAELADESGGEGATSLRQALEEVAGARYAVRSLAHDAEQLAHR